MKFLALLLATAAFASQGGGIPNLGGEWKLDRDASTSVPPVSDFDRLVISETEDNVQFQYEDKSHHVLAAEEFTTDWQSQPRFTTRTQVGYARARWDHNGLLVATKVVMDVDGYQSFDYSERWSLSPDGRTLTETSSDGKKLIYERAPQKGPTRP